MRITLLSITKETVLTAKGSYNKVELAYKGEDGQVKGKKIMSFGDGAPAFKVLKDAQVGEDYEVTSEKIGEYWVWTAVKKSNGSSQEEQSVAITMTKGSTPGGKVAGSNYETAEERAKKQVYIVRQSSITAAINLITLQNRKTGITPKDVLDLAKEFEAFVFDTAKPVAGTLAEMTNDVPQ